jgi:hypothetical protein
MRKHASFQLSTPFKALIRKTAKRLVNFGYDILSLDVISQRDKA